MIVIVPPPPELLLEELLELEELELLLEELLELEEPLELDELDELELLPELEELELLLEELLELVELDELELLLLEDELLAATIAPGSLMIPSAAPSASPVPPSVRVTETVFPFTTTPGREEQVPLLHFS